MNEKHIFSMASIATLCCCFGIGPILMNIKNTNPQKYASFEAWICDKYVRCFKKVPAEKSLKYAILAGDKGRTMDIILREENTNFLIDRTLSDENGKPCSPLIFALKNKREKIALELLSLCCDFHSPDGDGHTALYYARKLNMRFAARELEKMGAQEW
ncbi:MAG: ankyrin repeat domain-containing protein [Puniceicoccales bacterium]|nr:ankyrin repeat domain-containing protein [Puniceicoccales bacterium]